ncbi:MAG: hypothetical protein ACTH0Y_12595 [Luteimonas sp.]
MTGAWGIHPGWTAAVLVALSAPVIFGGLRRVARRLRGPLPNMSSKKLPVPRPRKRAAGMSRVPLRSGTSRNLRSTTL